MSNAFPQIVTITLMRQHILKAFKKQSIVSTYNFKFSVNSEANARRIALVESCFGSAGQPLSVPGRVLVGEGVLTKMCRKKPKPRQFYLFNDLLVYGNIIINKKKYNKQHIIPLEDVRKASYSIFKWAKPGLFLFSFVLLT